MSNVFKAVLMSAALLLPSMAWAQGKIAVVNLEQAILQTDHAQKRLNTERNSDAYKSDKDEFDRLKGELDKMVQDFQKDVAVMSQEQQLSARRSLASKQADLEHVAGKLQQAEQEVGQALLQEMSPKVQEVLQELINLAKELRASRERGEASDLNDDEIAFYDALAENQSAVEVLGDDALKIIAHELLASLQKNITIDWAQRGMARARMRRLVKRILRKYGYPPDLQSEAVQTVLRQAEELSATWAA